MTTDFELSMEAEGNDPFGRATRRAGNYSNFFAPYHTQHALHDVPMLKAACEDFGYLRTRWNAMRAAWTSAKRLGLQLQARLRIETPIAVILVGVTLALIGVGFLAGLSVR